MKEFLEALAHTLELPEVKATDELKSFAQWDSLAVLSVIAMMDANYGVNLQAADFASITTAEDLWNVIQSRKSA